jgi:peptidyl-prolyl cis-trans isomerase D
MLTALRKLAATWFAKILFALLVMSFAVWGIGDMAKGFFAADTSLAKVAGEPITLEEGQAALRREMQRLARQLGPQFEADPRIRRALAEQAVDQLVLDRVLRGEAARMNIAVPDDVLRDFVFTIPAFRGGDGRFSRPVFESFLRNNELTEPRFLALVRSDLARQQITMAVASGAAPPEALTKSLLAWAQEQRSVVLVPLPLADAAEPPAPEPAQLARFHENNPERFSSPELREATVAVLTAVLIAREVEISEDELAAGYEARRSQYDKAEQRRLTQVLVQDEAKAKAIAESWARGADFATISAEATAAGGQALELGSLDRASLPVPELAEAVFAATAGAVTAPVQSPFGWHVFRIEAIEPGQSRTLAEVREQLRNDLAQDKAADLAFERANRVEDALAGGATLAEVAQRFGLGLASFTADANGLDASGKPVELPVIEAARAPLLKAVFETERGAPPRLKETEAGFVAIDVKAITPPALRPLAEVEAEVRADWVADARRRAQEERAAQLLKATREGRPLAELAQAAGLGMREIGGVSRSQGEAATVPPELLAPLFELKPKEATMVQTRDGFAVAQLLEITAADPAADAAALARVKAEVSQAMVRDLEIQFAAALRNRADVRLNPRMLDTLAQP